jgi:DNA primase
MVNEKRKVIGIKCRNMTGKKWCLKGSKLGLYVPKSYSDQMTVYVMEGESDTAAALSAGLNAIGVPSASACVQMLIQFLGNQKTILVADNDSHRAGIEGAMEKARRMNGNANVALNPKYKDFREWYNAKRKVSIKDIEHCIIC